MSNPWFPNGCGLSIETIDGTFDLSDVTWQEIAPCGCAAGVMTAATQAHLIVTPEQAGRQFNETEALYERDVARGTTWRPREHKAACEDIKSTDCIHEPKWGIPPKPKPEGYAWAAVSALGSNPRYTHLVSSDAIEAKKARNFDFPNSKPLCGQGKPQFHWDDEWYATTGKIECSRCWAKGEALVSAVTS